MTSFTVTYLDDVGLPRVSNPVTLQDSTDPALPVVILLHGTAGTVDDMANPAAHPGHNHDYLVPIPPVNDLGWHPGPNFGIAGLELDPQMPVPAGPRLPSRDSDLSITPRSTARACSPTRSGNSPPLSPRSSGGCRRTGNRLPGAQPGRPACREIPGGQCLRPAMLDRLSTVVTLHAPHSGTELATIAARTRWSRGRIFDPRSTRCCSGSLGRSTTGVRRARRWRPFLVALEAAEAVLGAPFVPVHTFGGTSTLLSRARAQLFTFGSVIPQLISSFPPRINSVGGPPRRRYRRRRAEFLNSPSSPRNWRTPSGICWYPTPGRNLPGTPTTGPTRSITPRRCGMSRYRPRASTRSVRRSEPWRDRAC